MFAAKTIAVIGASDNPNKIAGRPYHFLKNNGFEGSVYAVNPRRETIQGAPAYPNLDAIGVPIDLAIIAVPASQVLQIVRDCVASGVKGAIIFAGGMAETGDKGREIETAIARVAHQGGLRLLGPNCMGLMDLRRKMYASFSAAIDNIAPLAEEGGIAVVSQSGALANYMLNQAIGAGIQIEKWIATGNESDVELAEAIETVAADPRVRGIVVYLEGARNGPRLKSAFKTARERGVPIAILKVGATEEGAKAVQSHTDALVGDDGLYDAIFREFGVQRVHTIEDLIELGRIFSAGVKAAGDKVLLTSVSGGVGIIMAEAAVERGLKLPGLSDAAKAVLKEKLPFMSASNPLDVTGQVVQNFQLLIDAIDVGVNDTGANIVINFIGAMGRDVSVVEAFLANLDDLSIRYPDTLFLTAGMFSKETEQTFRSRGRLSFSDPTRAVNCASFLAKLHHSFSQAPSPAPALDGYQRPHPTDTPDEQESYALLSGIGIAVPAHAVAEDIDGLDKAVAELQAPLVMKILSKDIAHKSEVGGVQLGLSTIEDARTAMGDMTRNVSAAMPNANIRGTLLIETARDFTEVVIGAKIDPQLGASIMVGLGGIFVEILADASVRMAPVSADGIREMLAELKAYPLLAGVRGQPGCDIDAIADAASKLSCFAAANANWLASIEINPFAVGSVGQGGMALDCAIRMKDEG